MEFVVESGLCIQPIVFPLEENYSQFGKFGSFLLGVPLSFLAEILEDAVVFLIQLIQGAVVLA